MGNILVTIRPKIEVYYSVMAVRRSLGSQKSADKHRKFGLSYACTMLHHDRDTITNFKPNVQLSTYLGPRLTQGIEQFVHLNGRFSWRIFPSRIEPLSLFKTTTWRLLTRYRLPFCILNAFARSLSVSRNSTDKDDS